MLKRLKLNLTGRHHLGIDDCSNIAKIVVHLYQNDQILETTTRLGLSSYPVLKLKVQRITEQETIIIQLKKRSLQTFLGLCSGLFKRQMRRAFKDNGKELKVDDDVRNLKQNSLIVVSSGEDFV